MTKRRWRNNGAKNGLWFEVVSTTGDVVETATPSGAALLVTVLNNLEAECDRLRKIVEGQCAYRAGWMPSQE